MSAHCSSSFLVVVRIGVLLWLRKEYGVAHSGLALLAARLVTDYFEFDVANCCLFEGFWNWGDPSIDPACTFTLWGVVENLDKDEFWVAVGRWVTM